MERCSLYYTYFSSNITYFSEMLKLEFGFEFSKRLFRYNTKIIVGVTLHFVDKEILGIWADPTRPVSYSVSLTLGWGALRANMLAHILWSHTHLRCVCKNLRQTVEIHTALE